MDHVQVWMESNKLKLNEEKTEAMVVGSQSMTSISGTGHLEISSSLISFQLNIRIWELFSIQVLPCVIVSSLSVAQLTQNLSLIHI